MWAKLLLVLLVFSFFAPVCFSLDAAQVQTIKEKLLALKLKLTDSEKLIESLKASIIESESRLEELGNINQKLSDSLKQLQFLLAEYQSKQDELKTQIKTLSESLTKYLESSMKEKIEVGIITGLIAIIAGIFIGHYVWK